MKYFKPAKGHIGQEGKENNPLDPFYNNYFKLAKSIKNWQLAFLSIFILFMISLFVTLKIATQSKIIPYVVEVNKESGIIKGVGFINNIKYKTSDKLIISVLRQHILQTRFIPVDPVVYGKNITEAYYFLSNRMSKKLISYIKTDDVEQKIKAGESRDVNISSILKIDENIYQIRWIETTYNKEGNIIGTDKMSGIFTVKINSDEKDEQQILINPLGIIITDFTYSKDFLNDNK